MKTKKIKIEMQVTEAQALAINAMIKQWNLLGSIGKSQYVAFFADGDGNFHPDAKVESEWDLEKNKDLEIFSIEKREKGVTYMDYDPVAEMISHRENASEDFVKEMIEKKKEQLNKEFTR